MARLLSTVGGGLRGLGVVHDLLELGRARREVGLERGRGGLELLRLAGQQVGAHGGAGLSLLEPGDARAECIEVLLLAGGRARDELAASANPRHGLVGRVTGEDGLVALPQRYVLGVECGDRVGQLAPLGCSARRLLGLGGLQLGGETSGLGLEGGDDVDVGGRVERGGRGPGPLAEDALKAAGALDQALHAAERVGQVGLSSRRELGGGLGGLGVELLEGGVELALLVAAHGQVLGGGASASGELGELRAGQVAPHAEQLGSHGVVRTRRGSLALEGPDLPPDLAHQVAQALEVLGRGGEPALGALAAPPVLEHAGRLLDDGPAVLGTGVEDGVELALADDHVLLTPHARVGEQLLDVEQAAGRTVDGVLAVARAEQRAGDGDLGQVDRQLARRVVDGEGNFGATELRT